MQTPTVGSAHPFPPSSEVVAAYESWRAALPEPAELVGRSHDGFGGRLHRNDEGRAVATALAACLEQGQACSVVRLGDGEGAVLTRGVEVAPVLSEYSQAAASRRHFGDPQIVPAQGQRLFDDLALALAGASFIGLPPAMSYPILMRNEPAKLQINAIVAVASVFVYLDQHRTELHLDRTVMCSSELHRSLLPHYRELVGGRTIGLVSCHERLPGVLRQRMGVHDVRLHLVPRQSLGQGISDHYPRRYLELLDELAASDVEGMLYLVAAGIAGKAYCETVRQGGGVALDIGSIADVWMGEVTRRVNRDLVEEWRLV